MNFLNPLALIGLIAGSIPLILHLINMRKLKNVEFSTLRFLKELQKTRIKRFKLKQLILLILRTLIVIFAVLAFARPTIEGTIPGFESYAKTTAVILLDNSFSMDVSDELGNRFNRSKKIAGEIIDNLRDGDKVSVIKMASKNNKDMIKFSSDKDFVKQEISKSAISSNYSDLNSSLKLASVLFDESNDLNKEIYIISDLQNNTVFNNDIDSARLFTKPVNIFTFPVGFDSKSEILNLSIDSVETISSIFIPGKPVETNALIRNNSKNDIDNIVVSLFLNGERVAQRSTGIKSESVSEVAITFTPDNPGHYDAYLEIEGDDLPNDNKRYFAFNILNMPKVAAFASEDNGAFLKAGYSAEIGVKKISDYYSYESGEISSVDLSSYDVLILTPGKYSKSDFTRIDQFASLGGGLIFFAGDNTLDKDYYDFLKNLGINVGSTQFYDQSNPGKFNKVDKFHPVFSGVFKGETDNKEIVETPSIFKSVPGVSGQSVISIPGGNFLTEARYKEGKVFYFGVSPNLKWSTFPLTGIFPVTLYRSALYLRASKDVPYSAVLGESFTVTLPQKFSNEGSFKILDPLKIENLYSSAVLPGGAVISFEPFEKEGNYFIFSRTGSVVSMISVNIPSSESILKTISKDDFSDYLEKVSGAETVYIDDATGTVESITGARIGTELWQIFLVLSLLFAVTEMLVARATKSEISE